MGKCKSRHLKVRDRNEVKISIWGQLLNFFGSQPHSKLENFMITMETYSTSTPDNFAYSSEDSDFLIYSPRPFRGPLTLNY